MGHPSPNSLHGHQHHRLCGKDLPNSLESGSFSNEKLQLESIRDIGHFGAQALLHPEKFAGRAISLAGDALTFEEANAAFVKIVGREIPQTYSFIGWLLLWAIKDVNLMFRFFEDAGYNADIGALRQEHHSLLSIEDWLQPARSSQKLSLSADLVIDRGTHESHGR